MTVSKEVRRLWQLPENELYRLSAESCNLNYGNKVFLRGLIEFSNFCFRDCTYCGISIHNKNLYRYRLSENEIIDCCKNNYEQGFKTFVLQGGEDLSFTDDTFCSIIHGIKKATSGKAAVTLSLGNKPYSSLKKYREAGADRYLIRFETSDPEIFHQIKPNENFRDRLQTIDNLNKLGYESGTGFLIGLPGETENTVINNIALTVELNPHMVGIGPFIPHPETPLKNCNTGNTGIVKKATAILRILLPEINMPAATASSTADSNLRRELLEIGANVLMPNIGPNKNKINYQLYPGKSCINFSTDFADMQKAVNDAGKIISMNIGNSKIKDLENIKTKGAI